MDSGKTIFSGIIRIEEILTAAKSLKIGNVQDMICNEHIKALPDSDSTLPRLAKLYNKCLDSGAYP